ncbi:MAG: hypothetical protein RL204_732 [Bacteroidota bacterium]|jgi:hypothetical protein
MKRLLLACSALVFIINTNAQVTYEVFEVNGFQIPISSNGDIVGGEESPYTMSVPNDVAGTIYSGNIWLSGLTSDGQLRGAFETFQQIGADWFNGPITLGDAVTNPAVMQQYNQVFFANSEDVETHIAYFQAAENNTLATEFPNGYTIPEWMFGWPAHGDYTIGQAYYLSPFFDYDLDGVYNPQSGDYPLFCGDKCAYAIFNDTGDIHDSGANPVGLEVHLMLYGFENTGDPTLENTVFLKYHIFNRGTQTLTDSYFAKWIDFDIGFSGDDYIATNVKRSSIYGYNGDDYDNPASSSSGFGDDLAAQGVVFLAGPRLDADGTDNPLPDDTYSTVTDSYGDYGWGFGDGIIDNERYGLSSSLYYNLGSNPVFGDPDIALDYYNYSRQIWQNGQAVLYGGNGVSGTGVTDLNAKYFYPDDSDPLFTGTSGVEVDPWTEESSGNPAGDRRMIGSCGPFTLQPGAEHVVDLAYVYARQSQADNNNEIGLLQFRMQQAKNLFNLFLVDCADQTGIPTGVEEQEQNVEFNVFPNPASDELQLFFSQLGMKQLQIFSSSGQLAMDFKLQSNMTSHIVDISALPSGIYFIKIAGSSKVEKLIVE